MVDISEAQGQVLLLKTISIIDLNETISKISAEEFRPIKILL